MGELHNGEDIAVERNAKPKRQTALNLLDDVAAKAGLSVGALFSRYIRELAAERIAADGRTCSMCGGKPLRGKRRDAAACSQACRCMRYRQARRARRARKERAGADRHT
jgi:hypothetical protein